MLLCENQRSFFISFCFFKKKKMLQTHVFIENECKNHFACKIQFAWKKGRAKWQQRNNKTKQKEKIEKKISFLKRFRHLNVYAIHILAHALAVVIFVERTFFLFIFKCTYTTANNEKNESNSKTCKSRPNNNNSVR